MKFGIGLFGEGKNWIKQSAEYYSQAEKVFGDSLKVVMWKVLQYGLHFDSKNHYEDVNDEYKSIVWNEYNTIIPLISDMIGDRELLYKFHWFNGMSKDSKIYKNHKEWKWKHIDWKTEEPYSYWAFDIEKQLDYFSEILDELPKNKVFIDSVQFNYLHYFYKNGFFRNLRNFKELMLAKEILTREEISVICSYRDIPVSFNTQVYHRTRFDEMNAYYSDFLTFEITHRCFEDIFKTFFLLDKYIKQYEDKERYYIIDHKINKNNLIKILGILAVESGIVIFSYFPLKNISNKDLKKIVVKYLEGD